MNVTLADVSRALGHCAGRTHGYPMYLRLTPWSRAALHRELCEKMARNKHAALLEANRTRLSVLYGMSVLTSVVDAITWPGGNEAIAPLTKP
jgi:hypothetical protein